MMMTNARQRLLGLRIWAPNYFNPLCNFAAFTFLMASAIHSICSRPVTFDFRQYYMGGLIARHGQWDSLYPIPKPGSEDHAGYPEASLLRPKYAELARAAGVDDDAPRFIHAPPVALLCLPFAFLSYKTATGLWVLLMTVCLWLVALQAARIYRSLNHRSSHVEGLLVVLIACSPLCRQAMGVGNVSPFVGLCVGAAAIGLIGGDRIRSSLGLILGAFGKYVTLVLVPLYVLVQNWRVLAISLVLLILICLATIAVSGEQPFVTFVREIAPTFGKPGAGERNITAYGFLFKLFGRGRVPRAAEGIVQAGELVLIVLGAAGLLRSLKGLPEDTAKLLAASLAMVGGFLSFSPQAWGHYLV
jgi:Glycosyltransferase family 87